MEQSLRLFLAVPLPGELREEVVGIQATLRDRYGPRGWARAETMHVTLRFLGDTPESRVAPLAEDLAAAVAALPPVHITIAGPGSFGARVLWLGVEDGGALARLVKCLEPILAVHGFPPDDRPFHPHVTICRPRVRTEGRPPVLEERVGSFVARSVVLFQSDLRRGVHVPVADLPLAGKQGADSP